MIIFIDEKRSYDNEMYQTEVSTRIVKTEKVRR